MEQGLRELLGDKEGTGLASALFKHPLIDRLLDGGYVPRRSTSRPGPLARGGNFPSHIPPRSFAIAIMEVAGRDPVPGHPPASALTLDQMRGNVAKVHSSPLQSALLFAMDTAHGSIEQARNNIESWYGSAIKHISRRYLLSTQRLLFGIALTIVVAFNINTLVIAQYLYNEPTIRVAVASIIQSARDTDSALPDEQAQQQLHALHLPVGWENGLGAPRAPGAVARWEIGFKGVYVRPWDDVLQPLIGWLITASAATLGALLCVAGLYKLMEVCRAMRRSQAPP
jgi:hypothetical protein